MRRALARAVWAIIGAARVIDVAVTFGLPLPAGLQEAWEQHVSRQTAILARLPTTTCATDDCTYGERPATAEPAHVGAFAQSAGASMLRPSLVCCVQRSRQRFSWAARG